MQCSSFGSHDCTSVWDWRGGLRKVSTDRSVNVLRDGDISWGLLGVPQWAVRKPFKHHSNRVKCSLRNSETVSSEPLADEIVESSMIFESGSTKDTHKGIEYWSSTCECRCCWLNLGGDSASGDWLGGWLNHGAPLEFNSNKCNLNKGRLEYSECNVDEKASSASACFYRYSLIFLDIAWWVRRSKLCTH